jgi:CRISPR-associated endoribonuclease Cas6
MLYESIMSRMESSGLFTTEQLSSFYKFQLIPDKEYLQKIKDSDKKFARIYPTFGDEGQKYEVRGYTFPFILYAAPEVRKFVFDCGLGALTHKGFGMLDLAQADLQRKTEPYLSHSVAQLVSVPQNGQSNGKYY